MTRFLKLLIAIINKIHDLIVDIAHGLGLGLTDKQLHFWLLGAFGVAIFVVCDLVFRRLARWSISAITFVYTFTVLLVLVMAIEIEQKVTQSGRMEFEDVVAGLSGFIVISLVYMLVRVLVKELKK
ncbi:MAG TPA: hypothetical protein VEG39_03650 [Clostridia bacterium]|nr:hypothetical protein [Clostridia bacterium]